MFRYLIRHTYTFRLIETTIPKTIKLHNNLNSLYIKTINTKLNAK